MSEQFTRKNNKAGKTSLKRPKSNNKWGNTFKMIKAKTNPKYHFIPIIDHFLFTHKLDFITIFTQSLHEFVQDKDTVASHEKLFTNLPMYRN